LELRGQLVSKKRHLIYLTKSRSRPTFAHRRCGTGIPSFLDESIGIYKGASDMSSLLLVVKNFLVREDGPTAVEYATALSVIMVICIASIVALGGNANKTYSKGNVVVRSTAS
jgi:pilus assembly protein Flp/PilA